MKDNLKSFAEKALKSFLKKKKLGYTLSLLTAFLISGGIGLASSVELMSQETSAQETLVSNIQAHKAEIQALIDENEKALREAKLNHDELIRKGDFYSKSIHPSTQIFFTYGYENAGKGKDNTKSEWSNTIAQVKHKLAGGQVPKGKNPYSAGEIISGNKESLEVVSEKYIDKTINGNMESYQGNITDSEALNLLAQGNGIYINQAPWITILELGANIKPLDPELPTLNKDISLSVGTPQLANIPNPNLPTITAPSAHAGISAPTVSVTAPDAVGAIAVTAPIAPTITVPGDRTIAHPTVATPTVVEPTTVTVPTTPSTPTITTPTVFTPPELAFVGTGFGQSWGIGSVNGAKRGTISGTIIIENYENYATPGHSASNPFEIITGNDGINISGGMKWTGTMTASSNVEFTYSETLTSGNVTAAKNAFINELRDHNATIGGNYKMTYVGGNPTGANYTKIFLSHNPAGRNTAEGYPPIANPGMTGWLGQSVGAKKAQFTGTLELHGSPNAAPITGTTYEILVGVEHQLWDSQDNYQGYSIFENTGTITLASGNNVIGIMIDTEALNALGRDKENNNKTVNSGLIVLNNKNSIGIDFGAYTAQTYLPVDVTIGNIEVNGTNNYGFRMKNIFTTNNVYYDDVTVSGGSGTVKVGGTNNVGLAIGKSLSSTATPYTQSGNLNHGILTSNPISNFFGVNVEIVGNQVVGFLRLSDYSTNNTNDFIFDSQTLGTFNIGIGATNSTLIRTDKHGIQIDKDITTTGTSGSGNTVAHANGQAQHIYNLKNITTGSGLTKTTGMASTGTGASSITNISNSGIITISGKESIGMYVDGNTKGINTGAIKMTGTEKNSGIANIGTFDMKGTIEINGVASSGIYNTGTFSISDNSTIKATAGATGIFSSGGTLTLTSGKTLTITVDDTSNPTQRGMGVYATSGGVVDISGATIQVKSGAAGVASVGSTSEIKLIGSTIEVDRGYAAYSNNNGKINLTNATLVLKGNSTAFEYDLGTGSPHLTLGNTTIQVDSNNVIVYDVKNAGTLGVNGLNSFITPVGVNAITGSATDYIEAAVDDATININVGIDKSKIESDDINSFYYYNRFVAQNSTLNVINNVTAELATTSTASSLGSDKYKNQVIALEMNASGNSTTVADSVIMIQNSVSVVAARKDNNGAGALGAFINYGTLNNNGKIEIQKNYSSVSNGTGIYGTNGAQINNNSFGEIEVYGEEGIGVYATSWRETAMDYAVQEFGTQSDQGLTAVINDGKITTYDLNSAGIYLENNSMKPSIPLARTVSATNTGAITVGVDSTAIYAEGNGTVAQTQISNTGILDIGQNSTGIYGVNNITVTNVGNLVMTTDSIGVALNPTSVFNATGFGTITDNTPTGEKILLAINGLSTGIREGTTISIPASTLDLSMVGNMTALYVQGATGAANNSTDLKLGANGVGIYVKNGTAFNQGQITMGSGISTAVGMYTKDGTITNTTSGIIKVGDSTQFGLVAVSSDAAAINNGIISLDAQGTTGVLVKDGASITDNAAGLVNFSSNKSFAIASDNANVALNGGTVSIANSGENIYVYGKNGTTITVGGNLTIDGVAAAIPQRSVGIYLDGVNTINNSFDIKATDGVVGLYATGASTLLGGSYTAEDDKTVGIYLENSGTLDNLTINSYSTGTDMAIGVYAAQGTVNIVTGLILNVGTSSSATGTGMYLSEGAGVTGDTITLTNNATSSNIGLYYNGAISKNATHGADINMQGTTQIVGIYVDGGMRVSNTANITDNTSSGAVGTLVGGNSTYIGSGTFNTNAPANSVGYMSINGTVENTGTLIMTGSGNTSSALVAKANAGTASAKNSGSIIADDATGIAIIGGTGTNVGENSGQINVTSGVGAYIENTGATFKNTGTINVTGTGAAIALNNTGANQILDTGILNLGSGSIGVYGENNSLIDFDLTIHGVGATGVYANTGTSITGKIDATSSTDTLALYLHDSTSSVTGAEILTGVYGGGTSTAVGLYLGGTIQTYTLSNVKVTASSSDTIGITLATGNELQYGAGAITNVGNGAVGIYLTGLGTKLETQGGTLNIDGKGIGVVTATSAVADIGTTGAINVNFTGTGGVLSFNDGGIINLGSQINILSGSGTLAATRNGDLSNSGIISVDAGSVGLLGLYSTGGPHKIENTTTGIINVTGGGVGLATTGLGGTVSVINDGTINVSGNSSVGMYTGIGAIDNSNGIINVTDNGIGAYITDLGTITNLGTIDVTGGVAYVVEGIALGSAPTGNIILNQGTASNYSIGGYYKDVNGLIVLPTLSRDDYSIILAIDGGTNNISAVSSGTATNKNQIGIYSTNSNTTFGIVTADGDENIGIYGENSAISIGTLTIGGTILSSASSDMSKSSVGAYINQGILSASLIDVKDNGIGVFGNDSNVNIDTLQIGEKGLGAYVSGTGIETLSLTTFANIGKGSLGLSGKNTNIVSNATMNIANGTAVGIMSEGTGNISYNGTMTIADQATSTASIGIYKGTGRIIKKDTLGNVELDFNGNEIELSSGIYTEGTITTTGLIDIGDNGYGIYVDNRANSFSTGVVIVNNGASLDLSEAAVGIFAGGNVVANNTGNIIVGKTYLGPNNDHTDIENHLNSVGIYATQGSTVVNTNGAIIDSLQDHSLGIYAKGNVTNIINNGTINVDNGGVGILAIEYATIVNNGTINTGYNSGKCGQSNVGVGLYSGATFTNSISGTINVGDGVGVYISNTSTFTNNGTINIDDGTGVTGDGTLVNNGTIVVKDLDGSGTSIGSKQSSSKPDPLNHGAITITDDGRVIVNNQYIHSGTFVADHVVSNGAIVNIVNPSGDYMFNVNTIEGEITLDSNFIKEGNGYGWTVDNFLNTALLASNGAKNLTITTSPLFVAEINNNSLVIAKQPYAYLVTGSQFDNLYNGLDSLLALDQSGTSASSQLLKELNAYLDNIYTTQGQDAFESEAARALAETRGDVYTTIQQRMNHVQNAFNSAFNELVSSHNFTKDTGKYSVIYQKGSYEDKTLGVDDYDYRVQGLLYMQEHEGKKYGNKWGYSLGFAVSRFDFDDAPTYGDDSKEDVYSLRAGIHNVHTFDEDDIWTLRSRLEIGYNRHETERTLELDKTYKNKGKFNSYNVSLDNRLSKSLYRSLRSEIKIYGDLNIEYGHIDSFTEKAKGNSALELKLKQRDYYSVEAALGIQGSTRTHLGRKMSLKLSGDLSYGYDLGNSYDKRVKAKVDGGTEGWYNLIRPEEEKGHIKGVVGLTLERADNFGVTLELDARKYQHKKDTDLRYGIRFNYKFSN